MSGVSFLTAADVPPNLLRLQPGDVLHWTREVRTVERVGYRKTAADFITEADDLLDSNEGRRITLALAKLLGTQVSLRLEWSAARALASKAGMGGPERGLHVREPFMYPGIYEATPVVVHSTRIVRLGRYYPPSGGGEDYESGGITNVRSVVLVSCDFGEVISGDLARGAP
jgi:hypothetical protein